MAMSDPSRSDWISIDRSGDISCAEPSICERNVTPCSDSLRSFDSDMTWKPPESVRIGHGHRAKSCKPPWRATRSAPGRSIR